MRADYMTRPGHLRPGDIFLGPIGGLTGAGAALGQLLLGETFRMGELSIRHAGIVVQGERDTMPVRLAQSMPGGAEIVPIDLSKHWTRQCAFVRPPVDYDGQHLDAAAVALAMVSAEVSYSFLSYPSLAAFRLGAKGGPVTRYINRRQAPVKIEWPSARLGRVSHVRLPVEAICSVFADQSWTLAGKCMVPNTRPQAVTPGLFANALMDMQGAVWCRPVGAASARSWIVGGE